MTENHFRKLERMYHAAPINEFYKPKLTIERGKTELQVTVRPEFFHAAGAVHGSVYFKMLDDAAYFAVNSLIEDGFVLTSNFNLYFLQPISEGILVAYGVVVNESKSSFIAETVLKDGNGNQVSRGSGTFVRSKIPLNVEIGYR